MASLIPTHLPRIIDSLIGVGTNISIVFGILYLSLKVSNSLSFTQEGHNKAPHLTRKVYGALLYHPCIVETPIASIILLVGMG